MIITSSRASGGREGLEGRPHPVCDQAAKEIWTVATMPVAVTGLPAGRTLRRSAGWPHPCYLPDQRRIDMAETVVERLTGAWARTDRIFEILAPGAFLAQPIALRHPFIFYVGHLPAFAWNHICAGVRGLPSLNAGFDELFSRGIDPDVDDPTHCHAHPDVPDRWPPLATVLEYRDRVRAAVLESVDEVAERAGTHLMARDERVFTMLIEHELMHQETLLYMMQQLPYDQKLRPSWLPPDQLGRGRSPATVRVPAGAATLGCELAD